MIDRCVLSGSDLRAQIKVFGAELCSLQLASGQELLWRGAEPWPRHAPVLFPIVGRLNGDTLRHGSQNYRMTQHGFARDSLFKLFEHDGQGCRLALEDSADTKQKYPFAFRLELSFTLAGNTLTVRHTVKNTGGPKLPFSLGGHPAFRWPLRDGIAKSSHSLVFDQPEPAPIRRISGGLLLADPLPTPIVDRTLSLDPKLFEADAIIMDRPASTRVRYSAPGAPTIEVSWEGFRELGIWSRADCDLLCIEPWLGHADPVGFEGEFDQKPGVMLLPAGEQAEFVYHISVFI